MHDLLRAYARDLAAAEDGEEENRAAPTRLFDHYLHTAAAAGLARANPTTGDPGQARFHWQEALASYNLGAPEADQARAQLTMAGDHAPRVP